MIVLGIILYTSSIYEAEEKDSSERIAILNELVIRRLFFFFKTNKEIW